MSQILLVRSWTEDITPLPLFQNTFILRRSIVANFADMIKVATCLFKEPLKIQKKFKELKVMY